MGKIKTYLMVNPINYVKDIYHKFRMYMFGKFRKWLYNHEFNEVLNHKLADPYYGYITSNLRVGVLSPVLVVSKMLEKHFGFRGYYLLNVHGIDVDTQQVNKIIVTIRLHRPGILIGKGGKDIAAIEEMLFRYFGKMTEIRVIEVRQDVNIPYCDF
jgi:hypothetical protein